MYWGAFVTSDEMIMATQVQFFCLLAPSTTITLGNLHGVKGPPPSVPPLACPSLHFSEWLQPYMEPVDSAGREDAVIADESWRRYLMRNDSIMVDVCTVGIGFAAFRSLELCVADWLLVDH